MISFSTALLISVIGGLWIMSTFMAHFTFNSETGTFSAFGEIDEGGDMRKAMIKIAIFCCLMVVAIELTQIGDKAGLRGELMLVTYVLLTIFSAALAYEKDKTGYGTAIMAVFCLLAGVYYIKFATFADSVWTIIICFLAAITSLKIAENEERIINWIEASVKNLTFVAVLALIALMLFGFGGYQVINYLTAGGSTTWMGIGLYMISAGFGFTFWTLCTDPDNEKITLTFCGLCCLFAAWGGTAFLLL